MIIDKQTELKVAHPSKKLLPKSLPSRDDIDRALKPLILSASGWRKVFVSSGDENSMDENLSPADRLLSAAMARVFAEFVKEKSSMEHPTILLGMDSRPTGPMMGDIMCRIFLKEGIDVKPLFIVAAPEIMASVGQNKEIQGFCYISASHNPVGHNGVKFGLATGGVIGGEQAAELIESFKKLMDDDSALEDLLRDEIMGAPLEKCYAGLEENKNKTYRDYLHFSYTVAGAGIEPKVFKAQMGLAMESRPLGVVGELNGSARSLSVDPLYLQSLGVKARLINNTPRNFVHAMVPEGDSLNYCREELELAHQEDPSFLLGYVPDCDGDRGNLVYFSKKEGKALILQAQQVFALSALAELTYQRCLPQGEKTRLAIAVNGPTSRRIDEMAETLGVKVFRAEVGEANVVNLAQSLRDRGYVVPILG
nr:hypothetical protein [Spirochaetaceae bacterium]